MTELEIECMVNNIYYTPNYCQKDKCFYPSKFVVRKHNNKIFFADKTNYREVHRSWLIEDCLYIYDSKDECNLQCTKFNQELNQKRK